MNSSSNRATFVIKHGVTATKESLQGFNPGFPPGLPLSPSIIRGAQFAMLARGVQPFEDGRFHGDISILGMYDLLATVSAADAVLDGFHSLPSKPGTKTLVLFGIRWHVSPEHKEVRIYGPHSDPDNVVLEDLTKPEVAHDR